MAKKGIQNRQKLAAVFVSFAILIMGTASLLQSMSLDYYSVLNTLTKILPASIVMGGLGWVMGMVLDKPRRRTSIGYNNIFVNDIIKNNVPEAQSDETEK